MLENTIESTQALIALTTGLTAITFMFQSRHHNLYEHNKSTMKEIDDLCIDRSAGLEMPGAERRLENLRSEYKWAKRRYVAALLAFILIMLQILLLFSYLAALVLGQLALLGQFDLFFFLIWIPAFAFHIIGDLCMALVNQVIIWRRWRLVRRTSEQLE